MRDSFIICSFLYLDQSKIENLKILVTGLAIKIEMTSALLAQSIQNRIECKAALKLGGSLKVAPLKTQFLRARTLYGTD